MGEIDDRPGTHELRVCHNDTFFPDNTGTRTEEVYFLPCDAIPTISEWGLIAMSLLMLIGGTLVFRRQQVVRS